MPTYSSPSGTQATGPSERGATLRGSFPGDGVPQKTIYATDQKEKEQSSSGRASIPEAKGKQPGSNGELTSINGPNSPNVAAGEDSGG